jgi:hypothetical protein
MTSKTNIGALVVLAAALSSLACAKQAPPTAAPAPTATPEPAPSLTAETEQAHVEGIAGALMTSTVKLLATVVSIDQSKRQVVLQGPEGHQWTASVGEGAIALYDLAPGDKANVTVSRELLAYVVDEETNPDATEVTTTTENQPGAVKSVVVETTQITTTIIEMDTTARTAILLFPDGAEAIFDVRSDVDMSQYNVGQSVVFLLTDMLVVGITK